MTTIREPRPRKPTQDVDRLYMGIGEKAAKAREDAMSREGKWTPGPWITGTGSVGAKTVWAGKPLTGQVIAPAPSTITSHEEAEANARLIAAAPQMAEALHALIATVINADDDPIGYRQPLRFSIEQARAALRAAGGE